jgi:hypothetical protein
VALSWVSVSLLTGSVIARFPDMSIQGSVKRVVGQYESATLQIPLGSAPSNLDDAVLEGATALVALDDATRVPMWGGYVTQAPRTEANDYLSVSAATAENYFNERYVGTVAFTGADQCSIAGSLVTSFAATGAKPGLPIRVATTASAFTRNRIYYDYDSTKVYAALQELMGVVNGPEWTVDWEWSDATHLTPVLQVSDRLGASPNPGLSPNARFFLANGAGNISSFTWSRDYTDGNGANDITALGQGQGITRPSDREVATNFQGRPTFEYRFTPPTTNSIADQQSLSDAAKSKLRSISNGSTAISITCQLSEAPKLGIDWFLGDDVTYDIQAPSVPNGIKGIARVAGYELTDTTISPILVTPDVLADGTL